MLDISRSWKKPARRAALKCSNVTDWVSGLNATDKMPMHEMPLIYVFGVWGLGFWGWGEHFRYWGFGCWHFVIGVLSRDLPVDVLYAMQTWGLCCCICGCLVIQTFWNPMANLETSISMVLTHSFEGKIWRKTDPIFTLTGRRRIFWHTHSSPFEASRHPRFISNNSFNWPVLLNLAFKTN